MHPTDSSESDPTSQPTSQPSGESNTTTPTFLRQFWIQMRLGWARNLYRFEEDVGRWEERRDSAKAARQQAYGPQPDHYYPQYIVQQKRKANAELAEVEEQRTQLLAGSERFPVGLVRPSNAIGTGTALSQDQEELLRRLKERLKPT